MNRKDTDLLDLFRGPGGGAPRRAARSASRASAGSSAGGRGGAISLDRRRAMLGAAAAVLVVVLAFVAGVGIGKAKGRGGGEPPVAARLAQSEGPTWALTSAPIPPVGLSGESLPRKVYDELVRKWPEFKDRVVPTLPGSPVDKTALESGHRCLTIVGFPDRSSAQSVQFQLAVFTVVGAGCPFGGSVPAPEAR
jgi:hypothetical protein